MNLFYLEEPSIKRKKEAIEYINEHTKYNSKINGTGGLDNHLDKYEEWLEKLDLEKKPNTCSENRCPGYTYFLIRKKDDKIIGMINIRYNLNEIMLNHGGHIGYGIRPTERQKGYNKINLYLGLLKCKEIGLDKVLLTANENNIASIKTILSLDGTLENKIKVKEEIFGRYWINVNESLNNHKDILDDIDRIIYLLSGFDKDKGFYKNQKEYLKKDIKNNLEIAFIASDFNNYDKTDFFVSKLIDAFKEIEIVFKKINIIDYRTTKEKAKQIINKTDIIYIMGGDTYNEFEYIKEYNLINPISNFKGTIIGISAGALNMSENVCYLDEYRNFKLVTYIGLGLVNINIYPHFDLNDKDFVKETLEVSKNTKLYALPNESFIRVKDNKYDFVGDYYIVENEAITKYENN